MKLLLVDDHAVVRAGLQRLLAASAGTDDLGPTIWAAQPDSSIERRKLSSSALSAEISGRRSTGGRSPETSQFLTISRL